MEKTVTPTLKPHTLKKIKHGFFTRQGGVSKGVYTSLNCSFRENREEKDSKENVIENRTRAVESLGLNYKKLCVLNQVHGNEVFIAKDVSKTLPKADAIVTCDPHLVLAIQTADCVPILFLDPNHSVIGAAHSGWRGSLQGVVQNTVKAMESLGAKAGKIIAAIGPCINQDSYEIGPEVYDAFMEQSADNEQFFKEQDHPKKLLFDLPGYVNFQLQECGVGQIERLPYCTYEQEDLFFSCRRSAHRHEKNFGVHFSLISLEE